MVVKDEYLEFIFASDALFLSPRGYENMQHEDVRRSKSKKGKEESANNNE
jgi:hypothetical protein